MSDEWDLMCGGTQEEADAAEEAKQVLHKHNAYTWAGRRAECALTGEFLPTVHDWAEVTCPRCLAARESAEEKK